MHVDRIDRFYCKWRTTWGKLPRSQPACPARMNSNDITFLFFLTEVHCALEKTMSQRKLRALFVSTTQRVVL